MAYAELCAKKQECSSPEPEFISQKEIDEIKLPKEVMEDKINNEFIIELVEDGNDTVNISKETAVSDQKHEQNLNKKQLNLEKENEPSKNPDKK